MVDFTIARTVEVERGEVKKPRQRGKVFVRFPVLRGLRIS